MAKTTVQTNLVGRSVRMLTPATDEEARETMRRIGAGENVSDKDRQRVLLRPTGVNDRFPHWAAGKYGEIVAVYTQKGDLMLSVDIDGRLVELFAAVYWFEVIEGDSDNADHV